MTFCPTDNIHLQCSSYPGCAGSDLFLDVSVLSARGNQERKMGFITLESKSVLQMAVICSVRLAPGWMAELLWAE